MHDDPLAVALLAVLVIGVLLTRPPAAITTVIRGRLRRSVYVVVDGQQLLQVVDIRGGVLTQVSLVVHTRIVRVPAGRSVPVVVQTERVADLLAQNVVPLSSGKAYLDTGR